MNNQQEYSVVIEDKNGKEYRVSIISVNSMYVDINCFNEDDEVISYIKANYHPNRRIYLSEVYTYKDYRGLGIASKLIHILEELFKEYKNYIIRGSFCPFQCIGDDDYEDEQKIFDDSYDFYISQGYNILTYDEYITNPAKFQQLSIKDDFKFNDELESVIVYKKLGNTSIQ